MRGLSSEGLFSFWSILGPRCQHRNTIQLHTFTGKNCTLGVEEALRDLNGYLRPGYTLIVRHARHTWQACPEAAGMLTEVWLTAAEWWANSEIAFHLIFAL